MGVGSEVYGSVMADRRGIGIELKTSYYRQALKNIRSAATGAIENNQEILSLDQETG